MRAVTAAVNIPVVAIGGIDAANLLQLQGRGLAGGRCQRHFCPGRPLRCRELYRLAGQLWLMTLRFGVFDTSYRCCAVHWGHHLARRGYFYLMLNHARYGNRRKNMRTADNRWQ